MDIEKPVVGFSPNLFGTQKKGICDAFCNTFASRPTFPWYPRPTQPTMPTLMNLVLTTHYLRKQLYNHLLEVGSVDLKTDTL